MTAYFSDPWLTIHEGDCRAVLAEMEPESVHCVVTSPPYFGLRDYGHAGQIGLEASVGEYVAVLVAVFREARRVLRSDGTAWINIGDSYAGSWGAQSRRVTDSDDKSWHGSQIKNHPKRASHTGSIRDAGLKPKDRMMIPARVALALQADGWWLRDEIVWAKPNPMPSSVGDRTTPAHEMVYLLSKSARYWYDAKAIAEPAVGQNDHDATGTGYLAPGQTPQNGNRGRYKMPDNWDTGPGGHKAYHRNGREKGAPPDKQRATAAAIPTDAAHAMAGFNDRWDASEDNGTAPLVRNKRSVWTVPTQPYPAAHYAVFPERLIEPMILAGCPEGGTVLDPFAGTGTVGLVAQRLSRRAVLIDLNAEYLAQCLARNAQTPLGLESA